MIDRTGATAPSPSAEGGRVRKPRADPFENPRSAVHIFSFAGDHFAYFVRTGDLVRLDPAPAAVFREVAAGSELEAALAKSQLRPEEAELVAQDLETLESNGYLSPEAAPTRADRERDIQGLLAHQPRNLMFLVTEACNLACTYCYELNQGVHAKARMLKQVDARRIIDDYLAETRRANVDITFFGGEPLLNFPVVRDTVEYAKQRGQELGKGVGFTMTTNLTLLTEEIADFLAENAFHVMVSLDGDRESNDRYRKTVSGGGTYDRVVQNLGILIAKMREAGVRLPKIRATLTEDSPSALEVEEHLSSLGTPFVEIGDTHGTIADGKNAWDVSFERAAESRSRAERRVGEILEQLEADPETLPDIPPTFLKGLREVHADVTRREVHAVPRPKLCGVCRNMKAVTPTGDLYPCHRYVGMDAFRFGNVHEGGLDQDRVRAYYDDIYDVYEEKCVPCWARHMCGGQCPWYLSSPDGSLGLPDDETCDLIRAGLEARMGLYAVLLDRFPEAFRKLLGEDPATMTNGTDGQEGCGC